MPTILMSLYLIELLTMMLCMGYVFILFIKKTKVFNSHLQGRRLMVAALLPILWFIHVYTEAYTVYLAGEGTNWKLPRYSIEIKIIMQTLSLIGGLILAMFVMGCKFGDK